MAKKIQGLIKLQIPAGAANPSPPVGPALGQRGVNIMEFCKAFNERTKDKAGFRLPVVITVYTDKSFTFEVKQPPMTDLIKGTVRKTLVLENLEKLVLLQKNKIESNIKEIIKDLTENKKTINFVAKKFKHDHQTIKTIANNYSSKKLTSTTIENTNVTSKEEEGQKNDTK